MYLHVFFQEKGKIPKVHLHETVEEMKKFNARRKLKVKEYFISQLIMVLYHDSLEL